MRIFLFLFFLAPVSVGAQKVFDLEIQGDYRGYTFIEMMIDLEKRYPVKFYYDPDVLPYYTINYKFEGQTLFSILQNILHPNGLVCTSARENGIVLCRSNDLHAEYIRKLLQKWDDDKIELPEFLTSLEVSKTVGQPPASASLVRIDGLVYDEQSKEPIPGVILRVEGREGGATTNTLGRYVMELPAGTHRLTVNYIGYRETVVMLEIFQAGALDVPMQVRALAINAVEIQGNKAANKQTSVGAGVEMLSTQTIKDLPAFMGEADVLKSLLILPGVSTVGEGAAGFNVRGGNIDQNLVIQDGMPFFNTSHVLGFFSVFNPDLVRSTTLYKGHMPARFGGRTASALEVKLRDGDFSAWHGNVGIGLAAAKAYIEGPVVNDKLSVLAGVRASYSDWMLLQAKSPEVRQSSAWFNDAHVKLSYRGGARTAISAGFQHSADYFRLSQDFGYEWGTTGGDAQWRQTWTDNLISTVTATAGKVKNRYFELGATNNFNLDNGLGFANVQAQVIYFGQEKHEISGGIQWNATQTLPQNLQPGNVSSGIAPKTIDQENGEEIAVFLDDEYRINEKWSLYAGLRYSHFISRGPTTVLQYEPGFPYSPQTVVDTVFYGKNEATQTYGGAEPRLAVSYRITKQHSAKLSYNRMQQFMHLISNTTAATPADVWQPSNNYLQPQVSDNFSAGWFYTTPNNRWEASTEIYYRNIRHVLAYEDFANLLLNEHLETELIDGKQRSYGAEWLLRKNAGRLTGWFSYTWSRAFQQAQSPYPDLSVNRGNWFPANYDQPHQLVMYGKLAMNPSFYLTFNFTYRSGRPVTAPIDGYGVGQVVIPQYSDRNAFRIPDYHRLDAGITVDKTRSKIKGLKWVLNISAYNLYSRQNPFSVYFKRDRNGLPKAYRLAVIGSIIPAANLTFFW
ncbi:MAG: TonB-dependent receptor [Saprospiraceae bacterium]|nr:TonB-dependent receptor [Saprospiraceae bacterium]